MSMLGGSNKAVIRDIQLFEQLYEFAAHVIAKLFGCNAEFLGFFGNLATVFVCTSCKKNVRSLLPPVTGQRIGHNKFHGMTKMWFAVYIRNRGGYIILTHYYYCSSVEPKRELCSGSCLLYTSDAADDLL